MRIETHIHQRLVSERNKDKRHARLVFGGIILLMIIISFIGGTP